MEEKDMKYILMMTGTKADFNWYATWSKQDLQAHFAFMHAFNKELKDSGTFVASEGLAFPRPSQDRSCGKRRGAYYGWSFPGSQRVSRRILDR
jgi:hypothetical protein